jgi:group I intron endonuclease
MKTYAIGRVYKIQNTIDDKIYVGSTTQTLSVRIGGHRRDVKKDSKRPIHSHMRLHGINNFVIVLIEQLPNVNKEQLRAREDHWIKQLDTVKNGLNRQYEDNNSIKCEHGKQQRDCKDCGGKRICQHNREKRSCKECGGAQICEHGKHKHSCKDCHPDKHKCEICITSFCSKQNLTKHTNKYHPIVL